MSAPMGIMGERGGESAGARERGRRKTKGREIKSNEVEKRGRQEGDRHETRPGLGAEDEAMAKDGCRLMVVAQGVGTDWMG